MGVKTVAVSFCAGSNRQNKSGREGGWGEGGGGEGHHAVSCRYIIVTSLDTMLPKIILKSFLLLSFKSRVSLGVIGPGSTEEDKAAAILV